MSRSQAPRRSIDIIITVFVIIALAAGGWLVLRGMDEDEQIVGEVEPPSAEEVEVMDPEDISGRFVVERLGIDAPMGQISVADGMTINPPNYEQVFHIRSYAPLGTADAGTAYLALHSVRGADVPGTQLIDIDAGQARVDAGEKMLVDGNSYTVTDVEYSRKTATAGDQRLWESHDGRLVVITCLQRPSGASIDNVLIYAELDD